MCTIFSDFLSSRNQNGAPYAPILTFSHGTSTKTVHQVHQSARFPSGFRGNWCTLCTNQPRSRDVFRCFPVKWCAICTNHPRFQDVLQYNGARRTPFSGSGGPITTKTVHHIHHFFCRLLPSPATPCLPLLSLVVSGCHRLCSLTDPKTSTRSCQVLGSWTLRQGKQYILRPGQAGPFKTAYPGYPAAQPGTKGRWD